MKINVAPQFKITSVVYGFCVTDGDLLVLFYPLQSVSWMPTHLTCGG